MKTLSCLCELKNKLPKNITLLVLKYLIFEHLQCRKWVSQDKFCLIAHSITQ